jgi:hypothetical protein
MGRVANWGQGPHPGQAVGVSGKGVPEQQRDYAAVNHIAKGKNIPPFLILHVADHPDTSAQAYRLFGVLKDAGLEPRIFGARAPVRATAP